MTASKKSATPKKTTAVKPAVRATPKPAAKTAPKPAAKPANKAAVKPVAKSAPVPVPPPKPVAKPAEPTAAKTVKPAKAEKVEKPKKPKLVRDSFTIPKAEYLVLDELKQRSARLAHPVKKSELLRAGIKALAALADAGFLAAVQAVPAIKTGRPKTAPQKPAV